ncbi:MAG: hypothetical protein OXH52_06955 [Gammaproteobacteria bacterium]|nr:hypothetical protein [Gammaproteobacteria bacterium]
MTAKEADPAPGRFEAVAPRAAFLDVVDLQTAPVVADAGQSGHTILADRFVELVDELDCLPLRGNRENEDERNGRESENAHLASSFFADWTVGLMDTRIVAVQPL